MPRKSRAILHRRRTEWENNPQLTQPLFRQPGQSQTFHVSVAIFEAAKWGQYLPHTRNAKCGMEMTHSCHGLLRFWDTSS